MYEELAGWSDPQCCDQWLNIQVETSDKWHSSGVGIGVALLNIFVSDMDSVTEGILRKFANDSKLPGLVNTLEGKNAIQGDLDRPVGLGLCKTLQVQGPPIPSTNKGWVEDRLRASLVRRTCGCWLTRSSTWLSNVHLQRWKSGAAAKELWTGGQGGWSSPSILFLWGPTWSTASSSENPSIRMWPCSSELRGGPPRRPEGWSTFPVKHFRLRDLGLFRLEKAPGRPHWGLPVPKEALHKRWRGMFCFTRAFSDRMRENNFKLRVVLDYILGGNVSLWGC